jgi:hypothetical protein
MSREFEPAHETPSLTASTRALAALTVRRTTNPEGSDDQLTSATHNEEPGRVSRLIAALVEAAKKVFTHGEDPTVHEDRSHIESTTVPLQRTDMGEDDYFAHPQPRDVADSVSNEPDGTYISSRIPRGINSDGSVRY